MDSSPGPISVFMVDDDDDERLLFAEIFRLVNPFVQFEQMSSASDLLQRLGDPAYPSLIFLDLNMPLMNGFECLSAIRENPNTNAIPVVIYSNSFFEKDIDLAFAKGANYFLTKSAKANHLEEALKFLLKKCADGFDSPIRNKFILLPPY